MASLSQPKRLSRVVDKRAIGAEESRAEGPVTAQLVAWLQHKRAPFVADAALKKTV